MVLIGSPGAGRAADAATLRVSAREVWVGAASSDPVTTWLQQVQDPQQAGPVLAGVGAAAGARYGRSPQATAAGLVVGWLAGAKVVPQVRPDLGKDPAGAPFGARRFHAETGSRDGLDFGNHSGYYRPGSESLGNLAKIVRGDTAAVQPAPTRPERGRHYEGSDPEAAHVPGR